MGVTLLTLTLPRMPPSLPPPPTPRAVSPPYPQERPHPMVLSVLACQPTAPSPATTPAAAVVAAAGAGWV